MMRFQVFISLWSVTNCLCIDHIPEVAKTSLKTKDIFFIKVSPLKRLIQTRLHHGEGRTPPNLICNDRKQIYYSRCRIIVAAAGAMSWRCCVSL